MPSKTCVITGGSRGIGLATALRFAADGYGVVLAARNEQQLKQATEQVTAAGGACEYAVANVGTPDGAARVIQVANEVFERRVDVLVNNAGHAPLKPLTETTDADFEQTIAANCASVFYLSRAAFPIMQRQGGGVIVNVSSRAARDPFPGLSVYAGAKAWVNLFTHAIAKEGAAHGIRVFAVAPGAVETKMLRDILPDVPDDITLAPDDVAAMIQTVCTAPFKHSSGETIFVARS